MHLVRLRSNREEQYGKVMELYRNSFPIYEQREEEDQIAVLGQEDYWFNLIYDENTFVGIILWWERDDFIYVEHFCISPELRGGGYGRRTLELLNSRGKKVILEIDPPVDSLSERRRDFYQAGGYEENRFPHVHPPYRKGAKGHSLRVMSYPGPLSQGEYDDFNHYLRKTVMGVSMILELIPGDFSIYKVREMPKDILCHEYTFISITDRELSVIRQSHLVPQDAEPADRGWKCFRIAEDASFEKYGMIAFLANIIAAERTSTLVVGTYDTDYLFVKEEKFRQVVKALEDGGCLFI